jgi:hypothetical protein
MRVANYPWEGLQGVDEVLLDSNAYIEYTKFVDEYLRRLERLAATGDPEAIERLQHALERLKRPPSKYYCYKQNNIMGIMVNRPTEGIGPCVVMEAVDEEEADERLRNLLGNSYYGYCECCGRRWGKADNIFNSLQELERWWERRGGGPYEDNCYVHLLDGTIASC